MAGLRGEYRHKLDAKGRVSLPSAFRKVLSSDSLVVTQAPKEKCLYVFEGDNFDHWIDSLFLKKSEEGYRSNNSRHIAQRKVLNSRARDVEVDSAGRIGLSAAQRELAGLEKDVVLVGDSDHFEIWDVKRWEDFYCSADIDALFEE